MSSIAKGSRYEREAEHYLCERGLRLVARNVRCRLGEIDLVMEDERTLVFVEVRFRRSSHYGSPLQSVTARKRERIIKAALWFLGRSSKHRDQACRFDAVGITGEDGALRIDWIKDAFSA